MNVVSQEFFVGLILIAVAAITLKLQQQEWYWETFFLGYWKAYKTPEGRALANLKCWAIVVLGVVLCLGLIHFKG